MTPPIPGVDSSLLVDQQASSTKAAAAPKVAQQSAKSRKWNTKNLGLRLTSDFAAGGAAAFLVAPVITMIDKAIMQNASGQTTLKNSIKTSIITLLTRPQSFVFSKPFALICMLYGGTYVTANTLDTVTSTVQNKPSTHVTSGVAKFAASSTANISLCLVKDRTFVKLFGPGGPSRPVPLPSYALFALRDSLTIFASFNLPPFLGPMISKKMGEELEKNLSGQTVAQFLAPATVQIFSTPMHLLGLDLYNRSQKSISWADRWQIIRKNWAVSAVARMCRIIPAYGVGGVVNGKVRKRLMQKLE